MAQFTQDERAALYALFSLEEHEIREGAVNKDTGKILWFTYVRREAIQTRLDSLFFGEWELYFLNPQQPAIYHKEHVDSYMGLSIRGIRREYNGSQDGGGLNGAKGAATDAFKRVSSMWGLGLYLQDAPTIRTEGYTATIDGKKSIDWKKKDAVELQARKQVGEWLKSIGASGNQLFIENNAETDKSAPTNPNPLDLDTHLGKAENPTPNDAWFKDVFKLTSPLYGDSKHQENSLNKAWNEKLIYASMSAKAATVVMFVHRIEEDMKMENEAAKKLIIAALGMGMSEWLKKNKDDFAKAWQIIQNYIAQLSQQEIPF